MASRSRSRSPAASGASSSRFSLTSGPIPGMATGRHGIPLDDEGHPVDSLGCPMVGAMLAAYASDEWPPSVAPIAPVSPPISWLPQQDLIRQEQASLRALVVDCCFAQIMHIRNENIRFRPGAKPGWWTLSGWFILTAAQVSWLVRMNYLGYSVLVLCIRYWLLGTGHCVLGIVYLVLLPSYWRPVWFRPGPSPMILA